MTLPTGTFSVNYAQDMGIVRTKTHWLWLAIFLIWLFTSPLYAGDRLITLMTILNFNNIK